MLEIVANNLSDITDECQRAKESTSRYHDATTKGELPTLCPELLPNIVVKTLAKEIHKADIEQSAKPLFDLFQSLDFLLQSKSVQETNSKQTHHTQELIQNTARIIKKLFSYFDQNTRNIFIEAIKNLKLLKDPIAVKNAIKPTKLLSLPAEKQQSLVDTARTNQAA